jgi:hypothetical protein
MAGGRVVGASAGDGVAIAGFWEVDGFLRLRLAVVVVFFVVIIVVPARSAAGDKPDA